MCYRCDFANIHNHTDVGSFDSILTADSFISRIKELGQKYVVQTEHGTMRGMIGLAQKAKKAGLKYIPGIEAYVTLHEGTPINGSDPLGRNFYHMLLLAKNKKGLTNLFSLLERSYRKDGHFYSKPRMTLEEISRASEGLIATTGCIASPFSTMVLLEANGEARYKETKKLDYLKGLYALGRTCDDDVLSENQESLKKENFGIYSPDSFLQRLHSIFGNDLYGELQDCGEKEQEIVNESVKYHCAKYGIPTIVTSDAHYAKPEESKLREIMLRIKHNQLDMNEGGQFYEGGLLHLKGAEELLPLFGEEPLLNTIRLVESCEDFEFDSSLKFPVSKVKVDMTSSELLEKLAKEEIKSRGLGSEYLERVDHELGVINQLGFAPYFIVLKEILDEARKRGIMFGAGRGSAAGSLISYLLRITEVDPIRYGLYFSRFLNIHRVSVPDADIDIDSSRRDEFIQMVIEMYGEDRVCQIMTYMTLKPKGIARDLGRIYDEVDLGAEVAKLIPPPLAGREPTIKEALEQEPKLREPRYQIIVEPMSQLEGVCRAVGIHAGGVVISPVPLKDILPFEKKENINVAQLSMKEIEDMGLIKFDFLGLRNIEVIDATCKMVGIDDPFRSIPLDDLDTFKMLRETNDFGGIFQFEGSAGIGELLKQISPESIEQIADATALFRPGALGGGMHLQYLEAKKGAWVPRTDKDKLLSKTSGALVYQEQIQLLCRELAGFTEEEGDLIRRAIGKKKPEELARYKEQFIKGCGNTSCMSEREAESIWSDIEKNGDYGFNLSHAVSYATLSYYTAYLRTHYQKEYMSCLLNASRDNRTKFLNSLKTVKTLGIKILPPQVNDLHELCLPVGDNAIRLGTNVCKTIKNAGKYAISATRKYTNTLFDFVGNVNRSKLNVRVCKAMVSAGIFDEYIYTQDSNLNREALRRLVDAYYQWYSLHDKKKEQWDKWSDRRRMREDQERKKLAGEDYGVRLIAVGKEPELPPIPSLEDFVDTREDEFKTSLAEYEILGCSIGVMPVEYLTYHKELTKIDDAIKEVLLEDNHKGKTYYFCGIINNFVEKRTRSQTQMATFLIEDDSGILPITVFPQTYMKLKALKGKPEDLQPIIAKVILKNQYDKYQDDYVISAVLMELDEPIRKLTNTPTFKTTEGLVFSDYDKLLEFVKTNQDFKGQIIYKRIKGIKNA